MSDEGVPSKDEPRGLPGGIPLPATIFVVSFASFVYLWNHPGVIDLGPRINPAGVGILTASASFLWMLVAIAKRPGKPIER